jgi:colanic acid biosynthesis glycosyl transferase WcaI
VIAGDGALDACATRAMAGLGNVTMLPLQPADRLNDLLAAGDVHLVIQREEAADLVMPSKVCNIMAAGRPMIATAQVGSHLHTVISMHSCGDAAPYGDVTGFVRIVRRYAADGALRRRQGLAARQTAERLLNRENILGRLERHLLRLAASRQR